MIADSGRESLGSRGKSSEKEKTEQMVVRNIIGRFIVPRILLIPTESIHNSMHSMKWGWRCLFRQKLQLSHIYTTVSNFKTKRKGAFNVLATNSPTLRTHAYEYSRSMVSSGGVAFGNGNGSIMVQTHAVTQSLCDISDQKADCE